MDDADIVGAAVTTPTSTFPNAGDGFGLRPQAVSRPREDRPSGTRSTDGVARSWQRIPFVR